MQLAAYSTRDLQNVRSLLSDEGQELTLERVLLELSAELGRRNALVETNEAAPAEYGFVKTARKGRACPTLGCRGRLSHWPLHSALAGCMIIGCKICYHSEVANGL